MKTICSILGLIAIAQAGPIRTSGHTPCPVRPDGQDTMFHRKEDCQMAAAMLGVPYATEAGLDDWMDGCIVHHGSAYFVGISKGYADKYTHGHHNGGSICIGESYFSENAQGVVRTNGAYACPKVNGQDAHMTSEQECRDAAASAALHFQGGAGLNDWKDGCIVNHGVAFWVGLSPEGTQDLNSHGDHTGGSLCRGPNHVNAPQPQNPCYGKTNLWGPDHPKMSNYCDNGLGKGVSKSFFQNENKFNHNLKYKCAGGTHAKANHVVCALTCCEVENGMRDLLKNE